MNIIISGRHFTVTNEMKQDIENRLIEILDNKSLKISTARVVLTMEKNRYNAEIIVNLKHHDIEAVTEEYDLYEAVDEVIDKIEIQVRRFLDKAQNHHRAKLATVAASGDVDDDDDDYEDDMG
ncbi:MAG: ribosome-associated translation inhibitor RaiA [Victivallaceae bacterium]|nr:ribosome-associated translation inhibitor RaiA [Victivallaceae bacterium]